MSQNVIAGTERTMAATQNRSGAKHPSRATARVSTETVNPAERDGMIALAAYFLAERRGFIPGEELEDWLEAEREVERQIEGS